MKTSSELALEGAAIASRKMRQGVVVGLLLTLMGTSCSATAASA
jgi:hypothetical protein